MAIHFEIFPDHGFVYVRYWGFLDIESSLRAFSEYASDHQAHPGLKQLVDLADITGFEKDYLRIFEMQMKKAELFTAGENQTIVVYYAPTSEGRKVAALASRSWEDVPGIITTIVQTEAQAFDILGLPNLTLDDLKGASDRAI